MDNTNLDTDICNKSFLSADKSVDLAIGTLTLFITICLLCLLNLIVYNNTLTDVEAIIEKMSSMSLMAKDTFHPEPAERLQFQFSVLCSPIFILLVYSGLKRLKGFFVRRPLLTLGINVGAINIFILYLCFIIPRKLLHINNTTKLFFANHVIGDFSFVLSLIFYAFVTWQFLLYVRLTGGRYKKLLVDVVSVQVVALSLLQIFLYNSFHLYVQDPQRIMETNAVFYSVTQVVAGKSLLVNLYSQYGLYAWLLCPLFKVFGLSLQSFAVTMAFLNALSFLLIYLGIRKILRNNFLALIVYLALLLWQYWQVRLPLDSVPKHYFQYWPIRFLFPSLAFFLVCHYFSGSEKIKRRLLPALALISSVGILWNFDSGLVVFGGILLSLIYSAFYAATVQAIIKKAVIYLLWMTGALFITVAVFMISTKMRSGAYPDFGNFLHFQEFFYISGFYMLPMQAMHFWNLPVLMSLIAGIYCTYRIGKVYEGHAPVLAFLFVLGLGLFAYFQGRSYDTTVVAVMYPSIIIMGIFSDMLLAKITVQRLTLNINTILFFILFLVLSDGALSMLGNMPAIHSAAWGYAFPEPSAADTLLNERIKFITTNIPAKDTVLIIANDYESYYYSAGTYLNPCNVPSSTELFFKSELYAVLDVIAEKKYPVVYDAAMPWQMTDTINKVLARNMYIDREIYPARNLFIVKPRTYVAEVSDKDLIYHYNRFDNPTKLNSLFPQLTLPDTFTMELFINKLDTTRLSGGCWIFNSANAKGPHSGIAMAQVTNDLTLFSFCYGDGAKWCEGVTAKLSCNKLNHLIIKVRGSQVNISSNNVVSATVNTGSVISNSDGVVNLNPDFPGTINEIRISGKVK